MATNITVAAQAREHEKLINVVTIIFSDGFAQPAGILKEENVGSKSSPIRYLSSQTCQQYCLQLFFIRKNNWLWVRG